MMGDDKEIDCAKTVVWTDQIEFLVHRQIAQMKRAESAEDNMASHGLRILRLIDVLRFEGGAIGIRSAPTGHGRFERSSGRRNNSILEPRHSDLVTRLHYRVFRLG